MIRPPTRSTRTYTLFPYTTLFRSMRDLCYGLVRVLDFDGQAKGQWDPKLAPRSEEHTSELQSLMRISYAVFCLKKKKHYKKKQFTLTIIYLTTNSSL